MGGLVYFSSRSENTRRFVERLGCDALRLPIDGTEETPEVEAPFVLVSILKHLIIPVIVIGTSGTAGMIRRLRANPPPPAQKIAVVHGDYRTGNFLQDGAGKIIADKCSVPLLYRFELLGTQEDVAAVRQGLERFWTR